MANIFEHASRIKLRFQTVRGPLSVEDLWDLPLSAATNASLDSVAKEASKALKEAAEESFIKPANTSSNVVLQLRMDIVKHVIEVRLRENENNTQAAAKAAQRQTILALIDQKQNEKLSGLTVEELKAMLDS